MIALIVSLLLGWLLLKMLLRAPLHIEPPAPQVVLHVHLHVIVPVKERPPLA